MWLAFGRRRSSMVVVVAVAVEAVEAVVAAAAVVSVEAAALVRAADSAAAVRGLHPPQVALHPLAAAGALEESAAAALAAARDREAESADPAVAHAQAELRAVERAVVLQD